MHFFYRHQQFSVTSGHIVQYAVKDESYDGTVESNCRGVTVTGAFPLMQAAAVEELRTVLTKADIQYQHLSKSKSASMVDIRHFKPLTEEQLAELLEERNS